MTWQLASFSLLFLALAAGFAWYERSRPTAKVLALVATLAALAVARPARVRAAPERQADDRHRRCSPATCSAARPGFAVGAVGALASNLFFGQGPHTPWQMAGWGGGGPARRGARAGASAASSGASRSRSPAAWPALVFGAWMDLHLWVVFTDHQPAEYAAIAARSLPFNLAHVVGQRRVLPALRPGARARAAALPRALRRRLAAARRDGRARARCSARRPAGAADAARVERRGRLPARRAERRRRLLRRARAAGGSNAIYSGWAVIGLAAAGRGPRRRRRPPTCATRRRRCATPATWSARSSRCAPRARTPTRSSAACSRGRDPDGSIEGLVNRTAFLVLALRAAGPARRRDPASGRRPRGSTHARTRRRLRHGRAAARRRASTTRRAALQGLVAAGRSRKSRRGPPRARAGSSGARAPDGGFPLSPGTPSNAQSTAWAVQGLVAAGRDPRRVRRDGSRTPIAYLRSLQQADGSIRYNRTSRQTPTWVTAQAIPALTRTAAPGPAAGAGARSGPPPRGDRRSRC